MRVVFLGTPEFAVPTLAALAAEHEVAAVFTQPDRPKGRGNQLAESPVKTAARGLGIAVHQPERIRRPESVELLRDLAAELMVVVGYGQIIPQTIIDLPRHGILNVHASLLPKYRGAAPIQWAIANGESETGVTIMQIDAGLDTGDMLLKERVAIGPEETAPELSARLAPLGAELLCETISQIMTATVRREKQNAAEVTLAPILKKEDGLVDWRLAASQIDSRLRGFTPWPGAYTVFRGQQLSITRAKPVAGETGLSPGQLRVEKRRLFAGCGQHTTIELLDIQPAGKKRMHAEAFLNGYKIAETEFLGGASLKFPTGYTYAATYAGIRKQEKNDLALIVSTPPARAAAIFTRNMVQAAPVRLSRKHLASSRGRVTAVLINAGNANCATRTGNRVALLSSRAMAKELGCRVDNVLPSSTGVIGVELDPLLITNSVAALAAKLSPAAFDDVANAILTTDTRQKIAWEEVPCEGGVVQVVGMAKGSGMIQPNMATMLAFVMTDAVVKRADLRRMLTLGVERSFHSLTVDGDTSTNDTLLLLANGASHIKPHGKESDALAEAVARVMERLAEQIAADGEGARKLIIVRVTGFRTKKDAARIARAVANSPLVKTAIAGSDPNWGRILAAAGYSGAVFDPADIDVRLQQVPVCRKGLAADYDEAALKEKLDAAKVHIDIVHKQGGKGEARFFTCDFTEGYIQINGSYRT